MADKICGHRWGRSIYQLFSWKLDIYCQEISSIGQTVDTVGPYYRAIV